MNMQVGNTQASSAPVSLPPKKLGQNDFLKLMIAQAQNQDPLNPQSNGEFISQLAQFSTNDGINNMQNSMQDLAATLKTGSALQSSSLVGHKVLVNNNKLTLNAEGEIHMKVDAPLGLNKIKANIYSENGELIKTIEVAQGEPGIQNFAWDGTDMKGLRAAAGKYRVEVTGMYAGEEYAVQPMVEAKVESIKFGKYGEGVMLNVEGIGAVSINDVQQISV